MTGVINLNRARKDKARRAARVRADTNAAVFGQSKAERTLAAARRAADSARLEGHRRDRPDEPAPVPTEIAQDRPEE